MTEFAAALNKQHRDEMAGASAMAVAERIVALERRLATVEARLADSRWLWENAGAALGTLPPAPAANTDPTA
jgi:hypothetical protein